MASLSMIPTAWVFCSLVIFAFEGQIESVFESIKYIHSGVVLSKLAVNESPSGSMAVGSFALIQSQAEILMFWRGCKYLGGSLENTLTDIVKFIQYWDAWWYESVKLSVTLVCVLL